MSPSILLVCGPGGSGVSTLAVDLARAVADTGRPVTLLALDPYDGATARIDDPRVRTVPADPARPTEGEVPQLLSTLGLPGDLLDDLQATSTAAQLRLLWSVPVDTDPGHVDTHPEHVDTDPEQVVVIDAGAAGPELARLVRTLPRTLRRSMPLGAGLLRSRRPLIAAALGDRWPGAAVTAAITSATERTSLLRDALCGPTGRAVVVGDSSSDSSGDSGDAKAARLAVGVALAGVRVHHVSRGAPAQVQELLDPGERVIDIQANGDGYLWRMPLPLKDFRDLQLRLVDDGLELSALGHGCVLDLPTALRRCHPSGALLRDGMLEVAFDPPTQQGASS